MQTPPDAADPNHIASSIDSQFPVGSYINPIIPAHATNTPQDVHNILTPAFSDTAVGEEAAEPEVVLALVLAPGGRSVAPVADGGRGPDVEECVVRRVDSDDCASCIDVDGDGGVAAVSDASEGGLGGAVDVVVTS